MLVDDIGFGDLGISELNAICGYKTSNINQFADEEVTIGIGKNNYDDKFTMDNWFRPDASHIATFVEGKRGEKVHEVHMKPGERWNQ